MNQMAWINTRLDYIKAHFGLDFIERRENWQRPPTVFATDTHYHWIMGETQRRREFTAPEFMWSYKGQRFGAAVRPVIRTSAGRTLGERWQTHEEDASAMLDELCKMVQRSITHGADEPRQPLNLDSTPKP